MKTDAYNSSIESLATDLDTNISTGLSATEAAKRLERDGYNEFEESKHTSLFVKFINQFKSFMIIVLIIAGVVSGVVGYLDGEGFTDTIIILAIVLINAIIGVSQEAKAEKSLDALKRMSAPQCTVIRDGKAEVIESRMLVVGDIVEIDTGDSVPADLRLTEAVNLKVQEAALTGESLPVEKSIATIEGEAGLGDRVNMAYQSCAVTYGRGRGIVVATGANTEVGKIAAMIGAVPETKTPLQIRLDKLGKVLAYVALSICCLIFVIGLIYGHEVLDMFMTAVSLAAAAIPEGLPAVSTIVLAVGVQRLAKRNAIVRNMPSVETLGSTTVICSDKTGTLTQNRMTVVESHPESFEPLINIGVLCNDTIRGEEGRLLGDPTETALVDFGDKNDMRQEQLNERYPRIAEIPFDSERKLMTTIHRVDSRTLLIATKGGFDELLSISTNIADTEGTTPLSSERRTQLSELNGDMARRALRVLCMAERRVSFARDYTETDVEELRTSAESDLTFVGMVGMVDPPRLEVKDAVHTCIEAGIKPVMITGDHKITAMAIAQQLGIMREGDSAYTGAEVEAMDDKALSAAVLHASVFARVSPEHKVRIVRAFQEHSNVVAMTGDGVNDAPALKLADIGVAMGITGTDVSKEAADVVLTDDNFSTIVSSVEEGRRIYDNVLKSIKFLLSTNFGELMLLFTAVIFNLPTPLLPIHILWINLVTDSLPALALGFDPAVDGIMKRKPIDPRSGIVDRKFAIDAIFRGVVIAALSLGAFFIGAKANNEVAMTMSFAVVAFSQLGVLLSVRTGDHMFTHKLFTNKYLWLAIAFVLVLMLSVLNIEALQTIFRVTALNTTQWLWVAGLSVASLPIMELYKLITKR